MNYKAIIIFSAFALCLTSCVEDAPDEELVIWGSYTDPRDGRVYSTITVANQTWFAKNLSYDGDFTAISGIADLAWAGIWNNGNPTEEAAWTTVNGQLATLETRTGKLYNWYCVNSGQLCPEGWHVPSLEEWQQFIDNFGGNTIAGSHMKAKPSWASIPSGDNSSGFTAHAAGIKDSLGHYDGYPFYSMWWTTEENDNYYAMARSMTYNSSAVGLQPVNKTFGLSCRCVKD